MKESGWNTFLIHSQLCIAGTSPVSAMPRIIWMVCSLAMLRIAANMNQRIGRVISIGRQLAMGLTCSLRYSSLSFRFSLSLSLAYFF